MEAEGHHVSISAVTGGYIVDYELPAESDDEWNKRDTEVFQTKRAALRKASEVLDKWKPPVKVSDITGKKKAK